MVSFNVLMKSLCLKKKSCFLGVLLENSQLLDFNVGVFIFHPLTKESIRGKQFEPIGIHVFNWMAQ